jgi:hypothetical protein
MRSVICAAAALTAIALATPAQATAPSTGSCPTATAMDFTLKSSKDRQVTGFIPYTLVNFVQGGAGPGCVVVMFTSTIDTGGATARLSPILDGKKDFKPSQGLEIDLSTIMAREVVSVVFVFPNVSPGPHTIQMKVFSFDPVNVGNRTTLVYHTP